LGRRRRPRKGPKRGQKRPKKHPKTAPKTGPSPRGLKEKQGAKHSCQAMDPGPKAPDRAKGPKGPKPEPEKGRKRGPNGHPSPARTGQTLGLWAQRTARGPKTTPKRAKNTAKKRQKQGPERAPKTRAELALGPQNRAGDPKNRPKRAQKGPFWGSRARGPRSPGKATQARAKGPKPGRRRGGGWPLGPGIWAPGPRTCRLRRPARQGALPPDTPRTRRVGG